MTRSLAARYNAPVDEDIDIHGPNDVYHLSVSDAVDHVIHVITSNEGFWKGFRVKVNFDSTITGHAIGFMYDGDVHMICSNGNVLLEKKYKETQCAKIIRGVVKRLGCKLYCARVNTIRTNEAIVVTGEVSSTTGHCIAYWRLNRGQILRDGSSDLEFQLIKKL